MKHHSLTQKIIILNYINVFAINHGYIRNLNTGLKLSFTHIVHSLLNSTIYYIENLFNKAKVKCNALSLNVLVDAGFKSKVLDVTGTKV